MIERFFFYGIEIHDTDRVVRLRDENAVPVAPYAADPPVPLSYQTVVRTELAPYPAVLFTDRIFCRYLHVLPPVLLGYHNPAIQFYKNGKGHKGMFSGHAPDGYYILYKFRSCCKEDV